MLRLGKQSALYCKAPQKLLGHGGWHVEELIKLSDVLDFLRKPGPFVDMWMSAPKVSRSFLEEVRKVPLSMFDVILTRFSTVDSDTRAKGC